MSVGPTKKQNKTTLSISILIFKISGSHPSSLPAISESRSDVCSVSLNSIFSLLLGLLIFCGEVGMMCGVKSTAVSRPFAMLRTGVGKGTLWSPAVCSVSGEAARPGCASPPSVGGRRAGKARAAASGSFPAPRWVLPGNSLLPPFPRPKQHGTSSDSHRQGPGRLPEVKPPKEGFSYLCPPTDCYPSELSEPPSNCSAAVRVPLPSAVPVSGGSLSVCGRR